MCGKNVERRCWTWQYICTVTIRLQGLTRRVQIITLLKPKIHPDSLSSYSFLYLPQYKKVAICTVTVTYVPQPVLRRHGSDSNKLISTIPCTMNYTTNMVQKPNHISDTRFCTFMTNCYRMCVCETYILCAAFQWTAMLNHMTLLK